MNTMEGQLSYGMGMFQQDGQTDYRLGEPRTPGNTPYNGRKVPFSADELQAPLFPHASQHQKRSRTDSSAYDGPVQSGGYRHTNIVITDASTMQQTDLSVVLTQMMDRCAQLEMEVTLNKITFESQMIALQESLAEKKSEAGESQGEKKKPAKQDKAIKDAVHLQAHALLDVKQTRNAETKQMELILPHPLGIDDEARQGYWNPNWLEVKPFKDPTNQGFVSAVIKQVIDNARATDTKIKAENLDDPELVNITKAAEQYMSTLIEKYKGQVEHGNAKEKQAARNVSSRMDGRKKTKYLRRGGAVKEFEETHNISGVAALLDKDWMSSEDEGPGKVDPVKWNDKAEKYKSRGNTKAIEVHHLNWRSSKLTRVYYALDKIGFKGTKSVNPRFHGFKENTNDGRPGGKGRVMLCMVDGSWLERNTIVLKDGVPAFNFEALSVDDSELEPEDLGALVNWEGDSED